MTRSISNAYIHLEKRVSRLKKKGKLDSDDVALCQDTMDKWNQHKVCIDELLQMISILSTEPNDVAESEPPILNETSHTTVDSSRNTSHQDEESDEESPENLEEVEALAKWKSPTVQPKRKLQLTENNQLVKRNPQNFDRELQSEVLKVLEEEPERSGENNERISKRIVSVVLKKLRVLEPSSYENDNIASTRKQKKPSSPSTDHSEGEYEQTAGESSSVDDE